jgi:CHAT domain-containing protein
VYQTLRRDRPVFEVATLIRTGTSVVLLLAGILTTQVSAGIWQADLSSAGKARSLVDQYPVVVRYSLDEELLTITLHGSELRARSGRQNSLKELRRVVLRVGRRTISSKVADFHRMVADCDPAYRQSGRILFNMLIKPVFDDLNRWRLLCLIPDDVLWDLPFQALVTPDGRHLLEIFPLFYAPSLTNLRDFSQLRSQPRGNVSLLSIGNPEPGEPLLARLYQTDQDTWFAPLPEAELEARIIAQLHGPHLSKVLTGRAATEAAVKRLAPGRHILHFATHSVLNDRNPLQSYLLLADSETEPEEDGLLEAREILQLNLQAELAILSACETARGRIGYGQGMVGLSWAFLHAGCRSVLVTQWKVDSHRTAELVVSFYQWLKSGSMGTAEALYRAARQMMRNPATRHPHFWAAMIVVESNR